MPSCVVRPDGYLSVTFVYWVETAKDTVIDGMECDMMVRDKKSMEFTVTRSLMKLFKTGSAAVVSECKMFFFPVFAHLEPN